MNRILLYTRKFIYREKKSWWEKRTKNYIPSPRIRWWSVSKLIAYTVLVYAKWLKLCDTIKLNESKKKKK